MGFLDQLWGDVRNAAAQQHGPLPGMLLSLLGDGRGQANQAQGLETLVSRFKQAGLGEAVSSWISNEQENKEVTPTQVQQALGDEHVEELSRQTGTPKGALLAQLASLLPQLIDGLTPNGQMPHAPPAAADQGRPKQVPGDAESGPARAQPALAGDAVDRTDQTEPTQRA